MEQLTDAQQTAIKKASSDRLRLYLLKAGFKEDLVLTLSRDDLMSNYAQVLLSGETVQEGATPADPDSDRARFEHEHEIKRMEMEIEREKLALEYEKLAVERARLKQESEIKQAEMEAKFRADNDEVRLLKRYGEALAQVLAPQTDDVTELPAYFRGVEMQFDKLKIPRHFRARLIYKYLSAKSRALCARLSPDIRDDYMKMKEAIFKEYGLSAKCFLEKFNQVRKGASDTFVLYGSKLEGILKQYLEARGVKDFDSLVSLLLADRIKSELSDQCLKHVISVESAMESPQWLRTERLTVIVDEFLSNCGSNSRAGHPSFLGQTEIRRFPGQTVSQAPPAKSVSLGQSAERDRTQFVRRQEPKPRVENYGGKRCHICNSPYHLQAKCIKHLQQVNSCTGRPISVHSLQSAGPGTGLRARPTATVNIAGSATPGEQAGSVASATPAHAPPAPPALANVNNGVSMIECSKCEIEQVLTFVDMFNEVDVKDVCNDSSNSAVVADVSNFDLERFVADTQTAMHYLDVCLQDECGNTLPVNCLFDSGTQVSVLREEAVNGLQYEVIGRVELKGFDNHKTFGNLIMLFARLKSKHRFIPMKFVLCKNVSHDCLLSLADYRRLLGQDCELNVVGDVIDVAQQSDVDDYNVVTDDGNNEPEINDSDGVTPLSAPQDLVNPESSQMLKLINEQKADESLSGAFELARANKGGYFLKNNLLFHQTTLLGHDVEQLVIPVGRRAEILDLAHSRVGCHMGIRRTKERIALTFTWPSLINDVIKYCRECEVCQKRARVTFRDRVPIEGGVVSMEPVFSHFYVDCLGPIFPYKTAYNYAIVLLDKASRFPHAVPLRSLTAKNCCEAMLSVFQFTGMPSKVTTDRASNFTGELTREFFRRIGCSPIWCTPRHPEANSCERTIGTIKSMIAKVAIQYPKSWHRYVDLILWAMRESVNESTNVPPYTLVFGHLPRGPLAVLRDVWLNEDNYPTPKNKSTAEFLKDLRDRLDVARSYADEHAVKAQQQYVERYNRRSCDKTFTVGEHVLVLQKDSTSSKLFSRWIGPAVVIEVQSPHSYVVELDDSSRRIIHANHLRKFYIRTQCVICNPSLLVDDFNCDSCTLISDQDSDFGELDVLDMVDMSVNPKLLPSQMIDISTLSHLSVKQQCELLQLLDCHANCFSDMPGNITCVEHVVDLSPGFKPKRMREYKVPECLKVEVEKQLEEMLANGIIRESTSPMCSPLVCVLKKGGGVRLAVDYRYVNSYTISDAFPIPDIEDVIQKVGGKAFISTFDCKQGYYQTSVRECDKWLTAFVCMGRLLEFNRTPFGMRNAGQTFVRGLQIILRSLRDFTDSYIDDSAVFSDEWFLHLSHVDRFLSVMEKEGVTLNLSKCCFAQHTVKFCGEIIGYGTRSPDPEKVAVVREMKIPDTKKQLRSMLGFFSYFRKHIYAFADKAKLLTDLTAKRVPQNLSSVWSESHTRALNALKSDLIKACQSSLGIVRFDRPFEIYVDASASAAAGYLVQKDDDGVDRPIAFFSSKFTPAQRNYAVVEREAYAALLALRKYKEWLFGNKVILHCDHNPLTYLTASAPKSSKLMRWSLALAEFDVVFQYKAGKYNVAADALSRTA